MSRVDKRASPVCRVPLNSWGRKQTKNDKNKEEDHQTLNRENMLDLNQSNKSTVVPHFDYSMLFQNMPTLTHFTVKSLCNDGSSDGSNTSESESLDVVRCAG